jgi:hypothetical protein
METALYNSFSTNAQTLAGALAIFVAHVELASGDFLWLSSVRPEEEVRYTNVAQVMGDLACSRRLAPPPGPTQP